MKRIVEVVGEVKELVAPRAGAWIETSHVVLDLLVLLVAPRAGAWIETGHLLV